MSYLHLTITGTTADDNISLEGTKLLSAAADETQADDNYTITCPDGTTLDIDEAGAETAEWTAAGVTFSILGAESFTLTEASLVTGFPTTSAGAITQSATNVAGSAVSLTEGLFCVEYNNDSTDTLRPFLYIPTIQEGIDTLATNVMNCQCDCEFNAMDGQKYIKARAYLDLIEYKARTITAAADITAINAMITKLTNFLGGTEELCSSC